MYSSLSLFIFTQWSHSIIISGWWDSNTQKYFPLLLLSFYSYPILYYSSAFHRFSISATTTAPSPVKFISPCYHHRFDNSNPVLCSSSINISRLGGVKIYCTTIFLLQVNYNHTPFNPDPLIASQRGVLLTAFVPPTHLFLVIQRDTMLWNTPSIFPKQVVTNHISDPKRRMACTTTALINVT